MFHAFLFGSATLAAILIRRSNKKHSELLNYSITGQSRLHFQETSEASHEVRSYLEERAVIIASLLARGASEIYLDHNQLPPGAEVITRQIQNGLLRERGLWQKLEQSEIDLASVADDCWTKEQQEWVVAWSEQLRLLRWVLGIDAELLPLAHFPQIDFSLSRDILSRSNTNSKPVIRAWDVRVQRDIALEYTARVVAELKARGLLTDASGLEGWADEFRAQSLGASTDYLAGEKTVGELDEIPLRQLGSFAGVRERYCSYLVDQLNALRPVPFSIWVDQSD